MLAVSTFGLLSYLTSNKYVLIIASASLMVALDFIIEPVAIHLDFWTWQNGIIPIQNYIMWLLVSLLMQWIIYSKKLKFSTPICFAIFITKVNLFII